MIIVVEGPDRVGKDTQIKRMLSYLSLEKPTHILHYSSLKRKTDELVKNDSEKMYDSMFKILYSFYKQYNFILNRSHLGELIWATLYRCYDPSYVLDLERKYFLDEDFHSAFKLITFIDDAESLIKRDDGKSLSDKVEDKKKEVDLFVSASRKTMIASKIIHIGGKSLDYVEEEVLSFIKKK